MMGIALAAALPERCFRAQVRRGVVLSLLVSTRNSRGVGTPNGGILPRAVKFNCGGLAAVARNGPRGQLNVNQTSTKTSTDVNHKTAFLGWKRGFGSAGEAGDVKHVNRWARGEE